MHEVISDYPCFASTQLTHQCDNIFNGIEVQFLKGEWGNWGYLNIYSGQFVSPNITIEIENARYGYSGIIMKGGQRMLLPEPATLLIQNALSAGHKVAIYVEGYATLLTPSS